jgi:hypothetical protein
MICQPEWAQAGTLYRRMSVAQGRYTAEEKERTPDPVHFIGNWMVPEAVPYTRDWMGPRGNILKRRLRGSHSSYIV